MARSQQPMVYGLGDTERVPVKETLIRHALPWAALPLLWLAGLLAYLAWGDSPALPLITPVMAAAFTAVAAVTYSIGRRHSVHGGAHLAATVIGIGVWLVLAITLGPVNGTALSLFVLFGAPMVLLWNVRMAVAKPKRGETEPRSPKAWGKGLLESVGVKGSTITPTEIGQARIAGTLELDGTHTIDDLQKRTQQLAAALEAPKGGVRISGDPKNAGKAEISVTLRDVLAESTPWPGPSHVGGTPWDDIPMGLYETGKELRKVVADKDGAKQAITQGMNGSGKSSGTKVEFAELMTRRETGIILIDTRKALQTFGGAARGIAKIVTKQALGERVVARLATHVIPDRSAYLGAKGLPAWQPGCGLTFLRVQVEEAASFMAALGTDDDLISVLQTARSTGVQIELSLQRPSHDQIPTSVRSELGQVACYGIQPDESVCLLPDEVQSAGADPRRWSNTQPGCCYFAGTGISPQDASVPLRTYEMADSVLAAIADRFGAQMDSIDPITVTAFGRLWDEMGDPVQMVRDMKAKVLATAGQHPVIESAPTEDIDSTGTTDVDDYDGADDEETVTVTEDDMQISTPDPDPTVTASIDDDVIEIDGDIQFGTAESVSQVSTDEARARVAARIDDLEASGADVVRVPDLKDLVTDPTMRSRGWFHKEFKRLVKIGRLSEKGVDIGEFRIIPRDQMVSDDGEADGWENAA